MTKSLVHPDYPVFVTALVHTAPEFLSRAVREMKEKTSTPENLSHAVGKAVMKLTDRIHSLSKSSFPSRPKATPLALPNTSFKPGYPPSSKATCPQQSNWQMPSATHYR